MSRFGTIDTDHLDRMTLGDDVLRREVLELFDRQAERLSQRMRTSGADAGECAHRLNGAARAVGAFAVAEAAEAVERLAADGDDLRAALATLDRAVGEARSAVARLLQPS